MIVAFGAWQKKKKGEERYVAVIYTKTTTK